MAVYFELDLPLDDAEGLILVGLNVHRRVDAAVTRCSVTWNSTTDRGHWDQRQVFAEYLPTAASTRVTRRRAPRLGC